LLEQATASSILRDGTIIAGLVGGVGVALGATTAAAEGTGAALDGMKSRVNRRDVLSHIELGRERQASNLCISIGTVLNSILHPPLTISDINKDYCETSMCLRESTDDEAKLYWRMAMSKLSTELNNFGSS